MFFYTSELLEVKKIIQGKGKKMTGNQEDRARQGRSSCHKGGVMMKAAAAFTGLLLSVFIYSGTSLASIDAPHNESRSIYCGSCHDSATVLNSPFWDSNATSDRYNAICLKCHTGTGAPYIGDTAPAVATHSSDETSTKYGTWSVRCVDCHDPHSHEQKRWYRSYSSDLYLASGMFSGVTAGTANANGPTSVFSYTTAITYKSGWDAASIINKTSADRRPILLPKYWIQSANFPVLDIDETNKTITVQGDVSALYPSGFSYSSFVILYGQSVKQYITADFPTAYTPHSVADAEVLFLDKQGPGSFAYDETPGTATVDENPNGICQVCHQLTEHFNQDGTISSTGTHSDKAGVNCTSCHLHSAGFKGGADHTGWVTDTTTTSCTTSCHTINTSPFTGTGEPHSVNGCDTCHVGTPKLKTNGGVFVTTVDNILPADGANGCGECHGSIVTDWYNHQVAHDTRAAGVAPCTDCHTATGGNATTMPTSSADDRIHDACATCHQADGSLQPASGYASSMNPGNNSCTTCHGANYFDSHDHGLQTPAYTAGHDVVFNVTVDISQDGTAGNECYQCHDDAGLGKGSSALSTWDSIKTEHATVGGAAQSSACATCHSYAANGNQSGDADTPLLSTVQTTISSGTGVTCVTCHVPKDGINSPSTSTHGGHPADFGKDTQCTTCHTGANVVQDIHGNVCSVCHSGSPSADTEKVGDALNGVDGDATLANGTAAGGTWTSVTCLTCHPTGTYDPPVVHHDDKNGYAAAGNCTQCHTATSHQTMIVSYVNCANCHTTTDDSAGTGAPVDGADPKVHDACTTCHEINGSNYVILKVGSSAEGHDNSTVGGTDGGGDCSVCHGEYFPNHTNANHTTFVALNTNCADCHTGTEGGTTTVPTSTADNKKHDSCNACHDVAGALHR
jgi:hypothetical protein